MAQSAGNHEQRDLHQVLEDYERLLDSAVQQREKADEDKAAFVEKFRGLIQAIIKPRMELFTKTLTDYQHEAHVEHTDRMGFVGPDPRITLHLVPRNYTSLVSYGRAEAELKFSIQVVAKMVLVQSITSSTKAPIQHLTLDRITTPFVDGKILMFIEEALTPHY